MIRFANKGDIPQLKKIWTACFDDTQEYIDCHYENRKDTARTIVLCENHMIVSMFDMVNIQIQSTGSRYDAFYIYAAATLPQYQGKGYMHRLIEQACKIGKQEGAVAAVLIPQTKSLVQFYLKQNFINEITNDIKEYQSKSAASIISPLSEKEFIKMKRAYEHSIPDCVLHSNDLCSLVYKQAKVLGGSIVKIETSGTESYAICFKEKRHLIIQEISSSDQLYEYDISALCDFYGVKKARTIRPGNKKLYGLARTLNENNIKWEDLYMNTMLD